MYAQKIYLQREAFCPKNTTYMKPYVSLPLATVSGKAGSRLTHVWRVFAVQRTFQCECILKITKKSFPCIGTHNCQQNCAKPWSEATFIVWSTAPLGTKDAISIKIQTFFIQENAFENVICKMAYYLHLHQYVQSDLAKFRLSRTPISVVESFSNFKWRKIRRWYSRTLCKISKWFDDWLIS